MTTRPSIMLLPVLVLAMTAILAGCGYNDIQALDEETDAAWSEVLNQYQRRADLIPNLVETVKAYAAHERQTFEAVTQARSQVAGIKVTPELLNDPEAFRRFQASQAQLSSALARLLAVAENYPDLKANESFRDLQSQLEGTENRITVARKRYIDKVADYNKLVRFFPTNLTARYLLDAELKPNFAVEDEKAAATPPQVKF